MTHKITKNNYFISSIADFKRVGNAPGKEPDYVSYKTFNVWESEVFDVEEDEDGFSVRVYLDEEDFKNGTGYDIIKTFFGKYCAGHRCINKNKISSSYWYTEEGVYRKSDHWGKCGNCHWTIDGEELNSEEEIVGFCRWEDFDQEHGTQYCPSGALRIF